jgi:hypothetical protein
MAEIEPKYRRGDGLSIGQNNLPGVGSFGKRHIESISSMTMFEYSSLKAASDHYS